jgi:hypothetical protein
MFGVAIVLVKLFEVGGFGALIPGIPMLLVPIVPYALFGFLSVSIAKRADRSSQPARDAAAEKVFRAVADGVKTNFVLYLRSHTRPDYRLKNPDGLRLAVGGAPPPASQIAQNRKVSFGLLLASRFEVPVVEIGVKTGAPGAGVIPEEQCERVAFDKLARACARIFALASDDDDLLQQVERIIALDLMPKTIFVVPESFSRVGPCERLEARVSAWADLGGISAVPRFIAANRDVSALQAQALKQRVLDARST